MEIWIVVGVLAGCMYLFVRDLLPVEVVAVLALLTLLLAGVLTADEAFAGFGDPALITIASVFVLTSGLVRTGVTDYVGERIQQVAKGRFLMLLLLLLLCVTFLSAFVNNVAATAVLLPMIVGTAHKLQIHPGRLLMPIAFGAMLGGTCTAIGTSTNMVLSTFLARNDLAPFGLFEFTKIGVILAILGIAYLVLIGYRLIPERGEATIEESYRLRDYITELLILHDSPLAGKTIADTDISDKLDLRILGLTRGLRRVLVVRPDEVLEEGDLLLVEGRVDNILKIKDTYGIEIKPDFHLTDKSLRSQNTKLLEVVIAPQSFLIGKTLKESGFRQRYDLVVLAIHRKGRPIRSKISQIPLELGDVLLVQGETEAVNSLRKQPDFLLLEDLPITSFNRAKARIAILIFLAVMTLGGTQIVPVVGAVLIGAVLMVLSRCITLSDAYQSISWSTLILIAGMSTIGLAMEKSGFAGLIAGFVANSLGDLGPRPTLAGFFLLTMILTQPMSNAAAALLVAPIALSTAESLNWNPRSLIMAVALAGSCSFMTPLEPASALVYGPGKYKFIDFVKCGFWLTLLLLLIVVYMVPIFWPFQFPAAD